MNGVCDIIPNNDAPVILDKNVSCLLYVDDIVILSTSAKGLQDSLNSFSDYCYKWGLDVNADKSNIDHPIQPIKKNHYAS